LLPLYLPRRDYGSYSNNGGGLLEASTYTRTTLLSNQNLTKDPLDETHQLALKLITTSKLSDSFEYI
jgi:hypothetical protein